MFLEIYDYLEKKMIPQLKDKPALLIGKVDIFALDQFINGIFYAIQAIGEITEKNRFHHPSPPYYMSMISYGQYLGIGQGGFLHFHIDRNNGDLEKAFDDYVDMFEKFFTEYLPTHKVVHYFEVTYSKTEFLNRINEWLAIHPEYTEEHFMLFDSALMPMTDNDVPCYFGRVLNHKMDITNTHERRLIEDTRRVLSEIREAVER